MRKSTCFTACTVCINFNVALLLHHTYCSMQRLLCDLRMFEECVCKCGLVTPYIPEMLILHVAVIHSRNIDY